MESVSFQTGTGTPERGGPLDWDCAALDLLCPPCQGIGLLYWYLGHDSVLYANTVCMATLLEV